MKEHIYSSLPPKIVLLFCLCLSFFVPPPWPPSAAHTGLPFTCAVSGCDIMHALPDLADTASLAWRAFACKLCFALVHAPIYPRLDTHTPTHTHNQQPLPPSTPSLTHTTPSLPYTQPPPFPSFTSQDEDHHVLRGLHGPADGTPRPSPRRPHHGGAREDGVLELRPRK